MGFAGEVEVHSVAASDRKVVFVISGPCELLLAKDEGHAQQVSSIVDHAAVVFYRKGSDFPTDEMWQAECERLRGLTGKGIYFHTASPRYTWESSDLTLISTEQLQVQNTEDVSGE